MTSDYNPQHGSRNLAGRTIAAVLSTITIVVGVVVSASGLAAGIIRSLDGPTPSLPVVEVLPAEPDTLLVCMGPGLSFGSASSEPVAYGEPTEVVAGVNPVTFTLDETTVLDGFSLEGAVSTTYPRVITQPFEDGPLAAVSFQSLSNLNVRGLAVAECQEPRAETRIVGGDITTGRQEAQSLSNPGDVPATVNNDIWGASGPIPSSLGQGILVQPGAQRVLSLAGLAPSEPSPVIRITADRGGIVAALHASIVRGLTADGLSVVTGQPVPSTKRVVPGVFLAPEDLLGPIKGKEGYADVGAALRILSPEGDTTAEVTIVRSGEESTSTRLDLVAGQVKDLILDELGSGDVAVFVESEAPIVAGVRQSVGNDQATDTSWLGTSYPLLGEAAVAVPPIGDSRITFANPGDASVAVNFDGRDLEVPAGGIVTRPLADSHRIVAPSTVYAAVSVRSDTIIGNLQVLPTRTAQESVRVTVR
ncbi:MAG: DUF5719 family protein [Pontimonas sp.]